MGPEAGVAEVVPGCGAFGMAPGASQRQPPDRVPAFAGHMAGRNG